ncbi:MAG: tRNA (guanine(26)-N(2))-dimethyltransferase [Halobacteriaceae archaeon]
MEVREGDVTVEVPEQAESGAGEAVFFNPRMELNRDVTVATLRAFRDREPRAERYLDATAATGVRGVRAAAEGWTVTMADRDPEAVALCRANLARNDLPGEAVERDARPLCYEAGPFDVTDVDPFGTPIPFVDAAFENTRDLVCVTATDTAPLCGAHFESGVRKYGAVPLNTEYHAEMGLRVLLSALVRTAVRYDVRPRPVCSHVSDHYVRTYLELERGASAANAAVEDLGHVHHCRDCLWRDHAAGLIAHPPETCPNCGASVQTAGPLWLGPAHDADFVRAVREAVTDDMGTAARARRLLDRVAGELHVPTHYDQHELYSRWGESAVGMDEFLDRLREAGHEATRAHYHGTAFKTRASVAEIRAAALA